MFVTTIKKTAKMFVITTYLITPNVMVIIIIYFKQLFVARNKCWQPQLFFSFCVFGMENVSNYKNVLKADAIKFKA